MVCAVGLNAQAACAAVRAGITGFRELPYSDNGSEAIVGAIVPGLPTSMRRDERLVAMLVMALVDCGRSLAPDVSVDVPLIVGLAESGRPGSSSPRGSSILQAVQHQLGTSFHSTLSRTIPTGHTSGLHALGVARQLLDKGEAPACLVAGVDSYINATTLSWLERNWRLKTSQNADGVVPGEAAAVLLVRRDSRSSHLQRIRVLGLGFGEESASVMGEDPLLGVGLAKAARDALSEA